MRNLKCTFARLLSLTLLVMTLSACAVRPATPPGTTEVPIVPFDLTRDLLGKTVGVGNFSAIDGTSRDFVAYLEGSWDGQVMTLVEDFEYADGVKERKTWHLTKLPNGEFSGVREDVVGTARGYQDGDAFRLEYIMAIPKDDGSPGRRVRFRDVLVKHHNGVIQNDATVGLWGFHVGKVVLSITPDE